MARFSFAGLATLTAFLMLLTNVAAECTVGASRFRPKMGTGYKATVIASGLRTPRGIAMDTKGNLLIAETQGGSIRRVVLKEDGDQVCVDSSTTIISGGTTNHGVDVSADGKTIFVSNLQSVTAYPYDVEAGTVGAGKVVVSGLGNSGPHPTRTVLASKSSPDYLLVARGSNGNVDTQTTSQSAGRCMIKQFKISSIMQSAATYTTGGEVVGWGLRNIVGMGEHPQHGGIWSVENSMDDLRLSSKDVHNDNPAEKFNYHGVINDTSNKLKGANFGYPGCVAAWDISGSTPGTLFNPDNSPKTSDCSTRTPARIIMPPHTAPLDVKWLPDGSAAFITFHGSWDRSPPDGYRLGRVDFDKDGMPKAGANSKTAVTNIMENTSLGSCPSACFRPVGLVIDKKKRIFMTSDTSGELYAVYGA